MESTTIATTQEVPVKNVFAMFRTVLDCTGIYTWKYQWKAESKRGHKFLVVLLMFHSCFVIALQVFNFVRLLTVISWNKLATGTEMVKVTHCLTCLFVLGLHVVSVTSARNNWDLLLEKLHEATGTVGRRLVKFYKVILGVLVAMAVGYSAYVYKSLSGLKPGDEMDIVAVCRMAPFTPDMSVWGTFIMLYALFIVFTIVRMYSLLMFYLHASYHIVREFKLLKKKVIDLKEQCATFDIIKDLRLQYEYSVSLTKILDSFVTWQTFFCYSVLLPNIFVFLYGLLRVRMPREGIPHEIDFLMSACLYITILTLAGAFLNTASKGMDDLLYQVEVDWSDGKTTGAYQTFLSRVSTSDVGFTALGFFTISKGTVITMVGTIVSYVVVILQVPSTSDYTQARQNVTLHQ